MRKRPSNLTELAVQDLVNILRRSSGIFGPDHAQRMRDRIYEKCEEIADGKNHGHVRQDVPTTRPTRFILIGPITIAYNPVTRQVIRIVDGRRNMAGLFP